MFVSRTPLRVTLAALLLLASGSLLAATLTGVPLVATSRDVADEFGNVDHTVTTIPAAAFIYQHNNGYTYGDCECDAYGCGCFDGGPVHNFFAGVNIPAGAEIEFVGLQSNSPSTGQVGVELFQNFRSGAHNSVVAFSSTSHAWDTDYNAVPLGYLIGSNVHQSLVLQVQTVATEAGGYPHFGWVEIWWRRTVSPAPANATFGDVPTSSPQFRYIEALVAAGITAGCGNNSYCPNNPVTRGQMAVFLAKALGLHWPN